MAVTIVGTGAAAYADTVAKPVQVAVAPKAPKAKPAPPAPIEVKPRLLPSGAPACGNVMFKSYRPQREEDPICPVIRNLQDLEASGRNFQLELHKLSTQRPR